MRPLNLSIPRIPVGDHHAWRVHLARRLAEAEIAVVDRDVRIAELEAAIDKLAQCKGRFHTEANFKALIEVRNKSLHK